MSHIRDWNANTKITFKDVKDHLFTFIDENTNLSDKEIYKVIKDIRLISLYGSSRKVIKYQDGFLFWKKEKEYTFHDIDIAIILEGDLIKSVKNVFVAPNGNIVLENNEGYHIKDLAIREIHYLIMSEKEYKKKLKQNVDYALAIKNGKRIFINDKD